MLSSLTKDRRAYSAPIITIYGDVTKLTASGTGSAQESSSGGPGGGCSNNRSARPC